MKQINLEVNEKQINNPVKVSKHLNIFFINIPEKNNLKTKVHQD